MLLGEHGASIHFLLSFAVDRRSERRIAVNHIDLERQWRLVRLRILPRLLALDHYSLLLNVDDIDRVNSFRLIRNSFDVLRRDDSDGLDDPNLLLRLRIDLTVRFLLLWRLNSSLSDRCGGLLDHALAATLRLLIYGAGSRAPIC